jgi:diketogulonate reductase-like aldo/keto reductase
MTTLLQTIPRNQILNNGVLIPALGLGTWGMQQMEVEATLAALELGYRHIDTAKIYGTEEGVGRAVRQSGILREEIFITTKLWNSDQGYDKALKAIEESLQKLNTPFVDLYLVHWPLTEEDHGENKREETWRAMEEIYARGYARAIGVSNYELSHLLEMENYSTVPPAVNQIERHPWRQQKDIVEYCLNRGIAVINYAPLTRRQKMSDPTVEEIANKHEVTDAAVLLSWGLQHCNIVIPKSAQIAHLEENLQAFNVHLDEEDLEALDSLDENESVV